MIQIAICGVDDSFGIKLANSVSEFFAGHMACINIMRFCVSGAFMKHCKNESTPVVTFIMLERKEDTVSGYEYADVLMTGNNTANIMFSPFLTALMSLGCCNTCLAVVYLKTI